MMKNTDKNPRLFRNLHDKGFGWDFQITDIRESTSDEITTIEYLNSEAFPGVTYQNAVDIVRLFGTDIFAFIKRLQQNRN